MDFFCLGHLNPMLIEIDDSIRNFVGQSDRNKQLARRAFENIAIAYRKGFHVVTGKPRTFQWLHENLGCGNETLATLRKLSYDTTQTALMSRDFNWFVQVIDPSQAVARVVRNGGKVASQVPLTQFESFDLCKESILLAENSVDCAIYTIGARIYSHISPFHSFKVKPDPRPGGGHTTVQLLRDIQAASNRFCICVVDSDRHYPLAPLGRTASDALDLFDPDGGLVSLIITATHELENLLPANHISKVYRGEPLKHAACNTWVRIRQHDAEVADHGDLKAGLAIKGLLAMPVQSPERIYWNSKLNVLLQQTGADRALVTNCIGAGVCAHPADCQCIIVSPLGEGILVAFKRILGGSFQCQNTNTSQGPYFE